MAESQRIVRHLNALADSEIVEVQWLLSDGTHHFERYTCPPEATRLARAGRNAAGQVTDHLHENAAGQKYMAPPPKTGV